MKKTIMSYIKNFQVSDPIFQVKSRDNFGLIIEEMSSNNNPTPQSDDVIEAIVCGSYRQDWDRKSRKFVINSSRIVLNSMNAIMTELLEFYELHSDHAKPHLTKTYKWLDGAGRSYFETTEDTVHLYRYIRSFWGGPGNTCSRFDNDARVENALKIIELIKEKNENR